MRRASCKYLGGLAWLVMAGGASALGFGEMNQQAALGQGLDFSVPLSFDDGSFVSDECVEAKVIAGDTTLAPQAVRLALETTGYAKRRIRVRTTVPIDEPIVRVQVAVGCPAQLEREFVVFVDPPTVQLAQAAAPPAPPAPMPRVTSRAEVSLAPLRSEAAPPPPRPAPRPPRPPRPTPRTDDDTLAEARPAVPRPRATVIDAPAAPAQRGSRLRLDAPEPIDPPTPPRAAASAPTAVGAAGSAAAATATAAAIAASAVAPEPAVAAAPGMAVAEAAGPASPGGAPADLTSATPAAAALDTEAALARQAAAALGPAFGGAVAASGSAGAAGLDAGVDRLRRLEDQLASVQRDAQSAHEHLLTLQARLQEAEQPRGQHLLVYALTALVIALLALVAWLLWWARERERQREAWWMAALDRERRRDAGLDAQAEARVEQAVLSGLGIAPEEPVLAPMPAARPGPASVADLPADAGVRPAAAGMDAARTGPLGRPSETPPHREISAEELIDLEQQVDFFHTLGQDDAAAGLLESHISASGGASPLPYLKLLEIHRQRGKRMDYERVGAQFRARFRGLAPAWSDDGTPARPLAEHAEAMARIQAAWVAPSQAMSTLEAMMFESGSSGRAFDLAACGDLLFLYEVARDLQARAEAAGQRVDLELPIGAEPAGVIQPQQPGRLAVNRGASARIDLERGDIALESTPGEAASAGSPGPRPR